MALVIWLPMIKNATNYAYGDNEAISSNIQTVNDGRVYQKTISASGSKTLTCSELNSNGLTISFWVKKPASGDVEIFKTSCSNATTTYPFIVRVSNQLVSVNCDYFGYLSTNLSDGWNHVVIRLGYYFELYVNDQLNRHEKTDPNRLYYFNSQYTVNFTGLLIQDFKVYNHYFSDFELDYHKREPMVKYKFDGSTLNYMIPHFNIQYPQEYLLSEDTAIGSCSAVLSRNKFIPEELPKYDLYTIIMWLKANSNVIQIKANNILSTFNSIGTGNINGHMTANREGYFYHNAGVDKLRKFNILAHHKYFLCSKTEYQLDSFVIMDGSDWYIPLITSSTPIYIDGRSFVVISGDDNDISNCGLLIWCKNHDSWKVYDCIIIDLTEIGLDNLTAQEFYTKYKEYLPIIAAGEEVAIDKIPVPVRKLPDEYQEVEYIKSTGTQYIDTGVNADSDLGFEMRINFGRTARWGAIKKLDNNHYIRHHNYNNYYHYGDPNYTTLTSDDVTVKLDTINHTITSNGVSQSINNSSFDVGMTYWLFARNSNDNGLNNNSPDNFAIGKKYYCKLFKRGIIVRDFVPCYRKADNKPGLYDLVEGIFYTNQGTGEFLYGPLKTLPDEYQQVEYLQSTGTQKIDSGLGLTTTTKIISNIAFTDNIRTQLNGVYVNANNRFQFGIINRQFFIGLGTKTQYFNLALDQNRHTFLNDLLTKTCSIDNESYTDTTIQIESSALHLFLFARFNVNGNTTDQYCYQKLYSCQIYDNNVLVRNFVPCYRKVDQVAGLYDLVNGVFYTNQGTGEFLVGNPVNIRLDLVTYNGYKIKLNESIPTDKWVMLSIEHNQSGFSGKVDNQSIDIEAEETDYSDSIGGFNGNIADFRLIPNINLDLAMLFENRAIIDDLGNIYIHKIKCNGVYDISLWNDGYVNENGDITTNDDYPNASYTDLFRVSKEKVYLFNNINNSVRIFEYDEYNNFIDEYSGYSSGRYSTVDDKLIRVMILDGSANNKNSFYFYDEADEFASSPSLVDNKGQLQANNVGEYQQQKAEAEIYKSKIIGNKIYED